MKKFLLAGCLLSLGNSQLNAREVPDTVLGVGAAAVVLGVAGAAKIIKNCRAELTKSEERKEELRKKNNNLTARYDERGGTIKFHRTKIEEGLEREKNLQAKLEVLNQKLQETEDALSKANEFSFDSKLRADKDQCEKDKKALIAELKECTRLRNLYYKQYQSVEDEREERF